MDTILHASPAQQEAHDTVAEKMRPFEEVLTLLTECAKQLRQRGEMTRTFWKSDLAKIAAMYAGCLEDLIHDARLELRGALDTAYGYDRG